MTDLFNSSAQNNLLRTHTKGVTRRLPSANNTDPTTQGNAAAPKSTPVAPDTALKFQGLGANSQLLASQLQGDALASQRIEDSVLKFTGAVSQDDFLKQTAAIQPAASQVLQTEFRFGSGLSDKLAQQAAANAWLNQHENKLFLNA